MKTRRVEDMSPDGSLELLLQDDGDVIVTVREAGEKGFGQSVEFCSSGGHSYQTLDALRALAMAMEADASYDEARGKRRDGRPK